MNHYEHWNFSLVASNSFAIFKKSSKILFEVSPLPESALTVGCYSKLFYFTNCQLIIKNFHELKCLRSSRLDCRSTIKLSKCLNFSHCSKQEPNTQQREFISPLKRQQISRLTCNHNVLSYHRSWVYLLRMKIFSSVLFLPFYASFHFRFEIGDFLITKQWGKGEGPQFCWSIRFTLCCSFVCFPLTYVSNRRYSKVWQT